MGWFTKRPDPSGEVAALRADIAALQARLDEARTTGAPAATASTPTPNEDDDADHEESSPWPVPPTGSSLDELRADVEAHTGTLATHAAQLDTMSTRLDGVEARLVEIAAALTNQLDEIGRELDQISTPGSQPTDGASHCDGVTPEVLDTRLAELRANQARIANEQARFAVSLHEQLAGVVAEIRRGR